MGRSSPPLRNFRSLLRWFLQEGRWSAMAVTGGSRRTVNFSRSRCILAAGPVRIGGLTPRGRNTWHDRHILRRTVPGRRKCLLLSSNGGR